MNSGDDYRIVTAVLRQRRERSIMVEQSNVQGWVSVPRSLIHGADDLKIDRGAVKVDQEFTFRLLEWKAEELGLAG